MSLTGNIGRVGIITRKYLPAALNQRVACIREKSGLLKDYLLYYFLSNDFKKEAIDNSKGVAQLNMSTEWLKKYVISYPSKVVQKRIIDKIEQLFTQLDNIEKALA